MNQGQVVRWDVSVEGLTLRLWIDDERGRHLAVGEVTIKEQIVEAMYQATVNACELARQGRLDVTLY